MNFCFLSVKNRHHSALFIQNGYLKLLIRQGPLSSNDNAVFASEWMWKVEEINDDQWHSYKIFVDSSNKVDERIFSCYSLFKQLFVILARLISISMGNYS